MKADTSRCMGCSRFVYLDAEFGMACTPIGDVFCAACYRKLAPGERGGMPIGPGDRSVYARHKDACEEIDCPRCAKVKGTATYRQNARQAARRAAYV